MQDIKTIFVDGDGGVETISPKIDITVFDSYLDRLKKDMYASARVVYDYETPSMPTSGIALKTLYNKMNLDANLMSTEFLDGLDRWLWFVNIDLAFKGIASQEIAVEFIFNMDMTINENEIVDMLQKSVGIISNKTIVANHPLVNNVEQELEQMQLEKQDQDSLYQYDFGQMNDTTQDTQPQDNQQPA